MEEIVKQIVNFHKNQDTPTKYLCTKEVAKEFDLSYKEARVLVNGHW